MNLKTLFPLCAVAWFGLIPHAQAQNLISSGSPLYKLPYKDTYVMQTLVAENSFRTQKPVKQQPGSFEKAKQVLPVPYWEGGVWPPTNYMVISGLVEKGYRRMAWDIARNDLDNIYKVYQKTGTFWEYYAPESSEPGFMARKDFVGWTGLAPISELIEYIFGIRADYPERKLTVDVNLLDGYGISRYPFGPDGTMTIKVARRHDVEEKPKVTVSSTVPVEVTVIYGKDAKSYTFNTTISTKK